MFWRDVGSHFNIARDKEVFSEDKHMRYPSGGPHSIFIVILKCFKFRYHQLSSSGFLSLSQLAIKK